jgi:hypothetical protein
MPASIPASIPAWVPVLFIGLAVLGYRQSFARVVKPAVLVAIALAMAAYSLYGVVGIFGASALALLAWAKGYALVLALATPRVAAGGLSMVGAAVRMPGSWAPMGLILGIFAARFVLGAAVALDTPLLHSAWFVAAMAGALGALSGGFGARALAVHRFASAADRAAFPVATASAAR